MRVFIIVSFFCLLCLSGCTSSGLRANFTDSGVTKPSTQDLRRILDHSPLARSATVPTDHILALSRETKDFLHTYVYSDSREGRLRQLLNSLSSNFYNLQYNAAKTYSAQDTFTFQEGNCLSISLLIVAMAREAGLKAYVNEVEIPPSWSMDSQNTVILYRHVNAIIELGSNHRYKVDVRQSTAERPLRQRAISDQRASAHYFNNLAVERLQANDLSGAFGYLRQALRAAPEVGYLWGTLGTVYRRAELLEEAKIAYLQALTVSPTEAVSASNLAWIYTAQQQTAQAEYFNQLASRIRHSNPYYQYWLAQQALAEADLDQAVDYIQNAIRREPADLRFYEFAATLYQQLGDTAAHQKQLDHIARLEATQARPVTPPQRLFAINDR